MRVSFNTAQLIGESREMLWGQTYHKDNLFIVLEVETPNESIPAPQVGKAILNQLIETFLRDNPPNFADFKDLTDKLLVNRSNTTIYGIVGWVIEDILYTRVVTAGKLLLSRGASLGVILDGEGAVSGRLHTGDLLFFFSRHFSGVVNQFDLGKVVDHSPDEIAEGWAPVLHKHAQPGAGGMIVQVSIDVSSTIDGSVSSGGKKTGLMPHLRLRISWQRLIERVKRQIGSWSGRQKLMSLLLSALVVIFVVSLIVSWRHRVSTTKTQAWVEKINSLTHQLEEGRSLIDINASRARTVLGGALTQAQGFANEVKGKREEEKQLQTLTVEIEQALGIAEKKYYLSDVPLFYDLTIIKNGAKATAVSLNKTMLAVLDAQSTAVYSLATQTKKGEIIAGGENLGKPQQVSLHGDNAYVLTDKGIVGVDIRSKDHTLVVPREDAWGEIVGMTTYAGNIYMVDASHNTLWKYQAAETGFSERITYLPDDASHSFGQETNMAIDGAVWTITRGRIVKFIQGKPDGGFSLTGLDRPFSTDTAIYTNENLSDLYILDRGNKRIVVFDKSGAYQAQYIWEKLTDVSRFVVVKELKKILLLFNNTVYSIDLKG